MMKNRAWFIPFDKASQTLRTLDKPETIALVKGKDGPKTFLETNKDNGTEDDASEHSQHSDSSGTGSVEFDEEKEYGESESIALIAYGTAYKDVDEPRRPSTVTKQRQIQPS